jgi:hypothetical protein
METSDVKRQVAATLERAKRGDVERRARNDQAAREYGAFLEGVAVPLFRQVANILKAEGYTFIVFTPSGAVRLASEARAEDYIELSLDTSGDHPTVIGTTNRARGHRVLTSERALNQGAIRELTEQDVLTFITAGLEAMIAR